MIDDKAADPGSEEKDLERPIGDHFPAPRALRARSPNSAGYPPADITIEHIGDLVNADLATLLGKDAATRE
jgi:hypothetical protein